MTSDGARLSGRLNSCSGRHIAQLVAPTGKARLSSRSRRLASADVGQQTATAVTVAAAADAARPKPRDAGRGRHLRRCRGRAGKSGAAGANAAAGEGSKESPGPDLPPRWGRSTCRRSPASTPATPPPRRLRCRLREIRLQGAPAAAPPAVSGSSSPPAEGEEKENEGAPQMPRRRGQMPLIMKLQKKQPRRMKIAELKQMCDKPDAVEVGW
ncbi:uncharacterized protein LOC119316166 [Triticum dicoccoides]|uniref:uncharacterized protein LOC119316166 n=1 Tax=Triticum dicoccoides TaxID=85692 RepID=UPI0018912EBD|nr:uncharacterized protein LOC119316166 [Triticum dicoccoides]